MNPKLKSYLKKFPPATVDKTMLDDLRQEMKDAVPEITRSIRQRQELAAELRIPVSRSSRTKKENQD